MHINPAFKLVARVLSLIAALLLLFLVLKDATAQTPSGTGTILVSTTITATAQQSTTDANAVTCVAIPSTNQVSVTCKVGAQTGLTSTYTVLPNSTSQTNAAVASYTFGGNSVTWLLYQPQSTGPISWQVAANGVMKQGQF